MRSEFTGLAYGICPTPGSWYVRHPGLGMSDIRVSARLTPGSRYARHPGVGHKKKANRTNGTGRKQYGHIQGKEIQKDNYKTFDWDFIEYERQNSETIKNIILIANSGNPFEKDIPEYNQTSIAYQYLKNNGEFFTMEVTGAIENEKNVWVHPPRSNFFQILELNPFPYIQSPYQIGKKWNWKLKIGDHWSDKRWMEWKGGIENVYDYEIIDKKRIETKIGNLECFIIKSKAKSRIGETELISYFNENYGFVKLEYKNIDETKTVLELEKNE